PAVLAHAPALVLETPGPGRDLELHLALAGAHVLLGVEAREVLADDLVGAPALDALGADVPGRDAAVGVEHEDGVVEDALDEEPQLVVVGGAVLVPEDDRVLPTAAAKLVPLLPERLRPRRDHLAVDPDAAAREGLIESEGEARHAGDHDLARVDGADPAAPGQPVDVEAEGLESRQDAAAAPIAGDEHHR